MDERKSIGVGHVLLALLWFAGGLCFVGGLWFGAQDREHVEGEAAESPAQYVAVDWLGRGQRFAAKIVQRRPSIVGVEYADGEREWVAPERILSLPHLSETRVSLYLGRRAQGAGVLEQEDDLLHVRLDEGGETWVSLAQLYSLDGPPAPSGDDMPSDRAFARRASVDPASLVVGKRVLSYYGPSGAPNLSRPYTAEILGIAGDQITLRWLTDQTEGVVPASFIVRVFEPPGALAADDRVWIEGEAMIATVRETRQQLIRLSTGDDIHGRWVESSEIIARVDPLDRERLVAGADVSAIWQNQGVYHGTLRSIDGPLSMVAWHDGSAPLPVALEDLVEVWASAALER